MQCARVGKGKGRKGWRLSPDSSFSPHTFSFLASLRSSPHRAFGLIDCVQTLGELLLRKKPKAPAGLWQNFIGATFDWIDGENKERIEAKNDIHFLAEVLEVGPTSRKAPRGTPFLEGAFPRAGGKRAHTQSSAESRGPSSRIFGREDP